MEENKILSGTVEELTEIADKEFIKIIKSGKYKDLLTTMSGLNLYSVRNQVLLTLQKPDVTICNKLSSWQYYGRSVIKGNKGLKYIAPVYEKEKLVDTKIDYVWDVSQVEKTREKAWDLFESNKDLINEYPEIYTKAIESALKNYTYVYKENDKDLKSFCDTISKKITIKSGMTTEETLKALIDGVAFGISNLKPTFAEALDKQVLPDIRKIETISIAYTIANRLGLDTSDYEIPDLTKLTDEQALRFRHNVDKVRSSVNSMLHNIEPFIQREIKTLTTEKVEEQSVETPIPVETEVESKSTKTKKSTKKDKALC